jgi:hypothetical protein
MKIVISFFSIFLFLFSCSTKPEDACDCIKESANKYVLEGVEIETVDDLREPCKDLIDKFQEDPAGRAMIIATATEVFSNLENKKFTEIDGEDMPEFPSYTFNTIQDFYDATRKPGGKYKYWRTNVEIKKAFLIDAHEDEYDNQPLYVFNAIYPRVNNSNEEIGIRIPRNKFDIKKVSTHLNFAEMRQVFDTKSKMFLNQNNDLSENDLDFKIANIMDLLIEHPNGDDEWGSNSEVEDLNVIMESKKLSSFLTDLKSGRYLLIEDKVSSKLEAIYGEKYSLTEVSIKGIVGYNDHEWNYIDATSIYNIKILDLPSELKRSGNKLDPEGLVRLQKDAADHLDELYENQVYGY